MPADPAPRPALRITAVILARNESDRIEACVRSVQFCDEVLVVDSLSTDGTAALARALGARVIEREWPGYRSQRVFAVAAATHDWILSIDADERVTPRLRTELEAIRERGAGPHAGYSYPRLNDYFGRFLRFGSTSPDRSVRFFDRRHASYGGFEVHEKLHVKGPIGRLQGAVEHYSYRSLDDHLHRMQKYARLWAENAHAAGRSGALVDAIFLPYWRFFRGYVLKLGFLDGWRGFVFHCIEANYVRQKYLQLHVLRRAAKSAPPR